MESYLLTFELTNSLCFDSWQMVELDSHKEVRATGPIVSQ